RLPPLSQISPLPLPDALPISSSVRAMPMTCPLHVPLHLPERSRSVRGLLHSHLTPPQPGAMSATAINRSPTGRMPPLLRGYLSRDRKGTRLNSSHVSIWYGAF